MVLSRLKVEVPCKPTMNYCVHATLEPAKYLVILITVLDRVFHETVLPDRDKKR
jgi:hypothetical protein